MPSEYKVTKSSGKTNGSASPGNIGSFSMKSATKILDCNGHVYNLANELRHAFGTNGNGTLNNSHTTVNGSCEDHVHTYSPSKPGTDLNGHGHKEAHEQQTEAFKGFSDFGVMDEIISSKGTVRGVKNRVRAGIATFLNNTTTFKNYAELEKDKIVVYATSVQVVRETFEKCKTVEKILRTHMVQHEERNVFMSKDHQRELAERLQIENPEVPQVFINGQYLGDETVIQKLNENGELRRILLPFPKHLIQSTCDNCGGYGFVPCTACHGSRKSLHRNTFTAEFSALRCTVCDENGLVRCKTCSSLPTETKL